MKNGTLPLYNENEIELINIEVGNEINAKINPIPINPSSPLPKEMKRNIINTNEKINGNRINGLIIFFI
jgi:hypothetical protein